MMPAPGGSVTVAWADELATVPSSPFVVANVGDPVAGTTFTLTCVVSGTLLASTTTATGVSMALPKLMSGVARFAAGLAGAEVPATDVMRSVGRFAGTGAVGKLMNDPPAAPLAGAWILLQRSGRRTTGPSGAAQSAEATKISKATKITKGHEDHDGFIFWNPEKQDPS
jgi:hypothetical protein